MSEIVNKYFSTGEFAKLCHTTKETLFHYDEIGILKPKKINDNGYRVYASDQFFDYDLICVLKKAGSSLKEIKWYMEHYDAEHFLKILREKEALIKKQKRELSRMEKMLRHTVEITEYALRIPYDVPRVEWREEETLLVVRLSPGEGDSFDGLSARLGEHFGRCETYSVVDKFPLGSIIMKEDILAGSEEESYIFSRVPKAIKGEHITIKPAGRYAVLVHRGIDDSFSEVYRNLLSYIKTEGLSVAGNAYICDLIGYLAAETQENFVMEISVLVE